MYMGDFGPKKPCMLTILNTKVCVSVIPARETGVLTKQDEPKEKKQTWSPALCRSKAFRSEHLVRI
eukprot:1346165-Amorphochlora_amoeboformis.AAC.1